MARFRPLHDKIIVKQLEGEERTKSGIILPESAQEKPQEGEVIEVGSGKLIDGKLVALDVKKGDKVIFSKYSGDEIKIDGEEFKIIKEEDILAVIE